MKHCNETDKLKLRFDVVLKLFEPTVQQTGPHNNQRLHDWYVPGGYTFWAVRYVRWNTKKSAKRYMA